MKLFSAPIGRTKRNRHPDIKTVESILDSMGYLDTKKTDGPAGWFGSRIERAIKSFQKDEGLKSDGVINPGGPTERTMVKKVPPTSANMDDAALESAQLKKEKEKQNLLYPKKRFEIPDSAVDGLLHGNAEAWEQHRKKKTREHQAGKDAVDEKSRGRSARPARGPGGRGGGGGGLGGPGKGLRPWYLRRLWDLNM